ncbi:hypothetical protein Pint_26532 [Pistacia integerrima]|uniref:Uncharacterized protein n=1 Tax=Pistacia integerrima TaxID=434235 RepID=A0ACC0YVV5_9ROSI|nr:hypothetical protein Pint_26532 [Pistacia integerrima]
MEEKDFGKGIDQPLLSSIDNTYVPEVSHERKPKVGQEFLSLDAVNDLYNRYAKEVGFNVRINSSKKNKETNVVVRMEYVCFKEKLVKKRDVGG